MLEKIFVFTISFLGSSFLTLMLYLASEYFVEYSIGYDTGFVLMAIIGIFIATTVTIWLYSMKTVKIIPSFIRILLPFTLFFVVFTLKKSTNYSISTWIIYFLLIPGILDASLYMRKGILKKPEQQS